MFIFNPWNQIITQFTYDESSYRIYSSKGSLHVKRCQEVQWFQGDAIWSFMLVDSLQGLFLCRNTQPEDPNTSWWILGELKPQNEDLNQNFYHAMLDELPNNISKMWDYPLEEPVYE